MYPQMRLKQQMSRNVLACFIIDCMHLEERINFLRYKVTQYRREKDELLNVIESSKNEKLENLETEIKGYKYMTEGCVKSCNKLTEEIVILKRDINKYANINKLSTSSSGILLTSYSNSKSKRK
jgi:hypothetical protein